MTIILIEEIRNNIANDKLDKAIEVFRSNCDEFTDELIMKSSQYENLKSQELDGVLTRDQINIERNRVCKGLLSLLNEVDVIETEPKNDAFNISSELKDILGLAELISRRKGKVKTSTSDFFKALNTMKPSSLTKILEALNIKKALPNSIEEELLNLPRKLSNNRTLSGCLTESLQELSEITIDADSISTADMFVDVSKFGKGKSVAKLRKRGIGKEEIDGYVEKFEIIVQNRE